jgi:hypothetical protein
MMMSTAPEHSARFVAGRRGAKSGRRREHSEDESCWSLGRGAAPQNPPAQPEDLLASLVRPLLNGGCSAPPNPPWAARSTAVRQLPYCFVSARSSSNV